MKQSVDAIAVEKWAIGYHDQSDSVILSFEFEGSDEPVAFAMSRDLAGLIGPALAKMQTIQPPKRAD